VEQGHAKWKIVRPMVQHRQQGVPAVLNAERGHTGGGGLSKSTGGGDVLVEIFFNVPQMMHTDSTLLGDARVRVEEPDAELPVVLDGTTTTTVTTTVTTVTIVTTVPRG